MLPTKSFIYQVFYGVLLFSLIGIAEAETRYVIDQLRVGIRPAPNNESAPLAVVSTGDKLELLDQDSGYAMVRTTSGVEGWIKKIYITSEQPAIVRLRELSQSTGGSVKKIRELSEQISVMQSANEVLNTALEEAKTEKSKIQMQLLNVKGGQATGSWAYWLLAVLIFTFGSFISGMYWYRKQAMKRLGGLRIYF